MSEKTQWSFVTEARCITVIHHFHKVQDQGLSHVSPRNLCSKQRQFLATFFFLTGSHKAEKRSGNYVLLGTVPLKTKFSS